MATPGPAKSNGERIREFTDERLMAAEPAVRFVPLGSEERASAGGAAGAAVATGAADEVAFLSIADLAERLRRKELSPVEVTRRMLERLERLDPQLNTTITLLAEGALAQARQAEQEILAGQYRGALHGVPLGIKDLYGLAGHPTTSASKVLADHTMPDATAVAALRRAGAVFLAKQNMHEFAFGVTSEVSAWGPVRNPWNTGHNPGGSSGGTAAAIAAGFSYGGLGSDTGGSIRIPAAMCGITGIKPTYGRVSRHGVLPLSWSLDHAGPLARSVEDCAILLQAIAGADPLDPTTPDVPVPDYRAALGRDLRAVVLGVPKEWFFTHLEAGVRAAVDAAMAHLESLGARLVEVSIPMLEYSQVILAAIITPEADTWHEDWRAQRPADYQAETFARLKSAQEFRANHYVKAQQMRSLLLQEVSAALAGVDALVAPTTAIPAPPLGQADQRLFGLDSPARPLVGRLACPFNLTGLPAVSVPCGFTAENLPVGLQIMGRAWDEAGVLAIAQAYQSTTDWHTRRPPVS